MVNIKVPNKIKENKANEERFKERKKMYYY